MFYKNTEIPSQPAGERVTRKILAYEKDLMVVEVSFENGAVGADHAHPHKQACYISRGEIEFRLEGSEAQILREGDSVFIPPNAVHGITARTAAIVIDIFTPMREDFIK